MQKTCKHCNTLVSFSIHEVKRQIEDSLDNAITKPCPTCGKQVELYIPKAQKISLAF
jgi:RNase P subunit RPR2